METLQEIGQDIWTADGPPIDLFAPIKFPSRMVVVRLGDGALWINSPVPASEAEMAYLARIGTVRYLIAPTRLHVPLISKDYHLMESWATSRRRHGRRTSIKSCSEEMRCSTKSSSSI